MIPPALNEASTDARLQGAEIRMLMYLHARLDPGEYRTLKLWGVACEIRMNKATASRAIKTLVVCGYLREGPRQEHGGKAYRLVYTTGEPSKKTAEVPEVPEVPIKQHVAKHLAE